MAAKPPKPKPPGNDGDLEDFSKYEKEIAKEVNKREAPTYIPGEKVSPNLESRSYFDVYELDLARSEDEPPLIIAGNDAQIALQGSLLKAVDQLLSERGMGAFNFKKWVEAFEAGFSDFTTGASAELKKMWGKEVWPGVEKSNAPKIVEVAVHGNNKNKPDFHCVQFFPDRKNVSEWIIFSGSYREISWQIVNWWNQKTGGSSAAQKGGEFPLMKGQPLIKLYFIQDAKNVGVNAKGNLQKPLRGEISFRIMDRTDNPHGELEKISKSDLVGYAKAIADNLGINGGYVWQKGKAIISYHSRSQGFRGWYLVKSKASGIELITKILKILNITPKKTSIKYSETEDAVTAYPEKPPTATILGETVTLARERPIVDVRFQSAEIHLTTARRTIALVRFGQVVYKP